MTTTLLKNFYTKSVEQPMVLGLGFFDCVHLGHKKLLETVITKAKMQNATSAVLTFSTNLDTSKNTQIYTFPERVICMQNLGIENVIFADFDEEFRNLSAEEFLVLLTSNFNISEVVAGNDFTYGKNAQGTISELTKYFSSNHKSVTEVKFVMVDGKKLSTSTIRSIIENGEVESANNLLSEPYFFLSTVRRQNGRGRTFGFPTANMQLNHFRTSLADGVYATTIEVDGKSLKCVTNVGVKPTFDDNDYAIESFILDFDGDLYGKQVKLIFWKRLRDVEKFDDVEHLKEQIANDVKLRISLPY